MRKENRWKIGIYEYVQVLGLVCLQEHTVPKGIRAALLKDISLVFYYVN